MSSSDSPWRGPLAALTYGVTSITIMMFNKAVLSEFGFGYPAVLTLLQSTVTAAALKAMSLAQWVELAPFDVNIAKRVAPLSFLFLGYVIISLLALQYVNMPMFAALRRTSVGFLLVIQYFMYGTLPKRMVMLAVSVMLAGAFVAAWHDMTFDTMSLVLLVITNTFGVTYNIFIKRIREETKLSVLSLLFYNNIITTPFLLMYCIATGEIFQAMAYETESMLLFRVCFLGSCILAFLLNWTTFRNTTINSPLTQVVTGQAKNFIAFLLSLVVFSDYKFDPRGFAGLLLAFCGGIIYAYAKVRDQLALQNKSTESGA